MMPTSVKPAVMISSRPSTKMRCMCSVSFKTRDMISPVERFSKKLIDKR